MLFNSLDYIFWFLPITILIYYFLLKKHQIIFSKIWLVLISFAFYSWWNFKYVCLLGLSVLGNFIIGNLFGQSLFQEKFKRKLLLIFGICLNITVLGYFKYANFFVDNINYFLHTHIEILKITLPLGISFFTFTQIAYLVDAYKKEAQEYNILNYSLFITFFPHLIAGPILHHKEMMPQFDELKRKVLNYKNLLLGLYLFIIGLFKKVCIADMLSLYVANGYSANAELTVLEAWIVMLSYTLQIYFDFSGYTDMALGSAKMLNIDLPQNFNSPYKAISIQDFWRRWHITLSRFLKDYVYIPLGGNRKGEVRTYCNLLITMLIGGLWHGASWLFVLWGGLHGLALCVNKLYLKCKFQIPNLIAVFLTFLFINFTWVIFRAENLEQVSKIYSSLFNFKNFVLPNIQKLTLIFAGGNKYETLLLILPLALILIYLWNSRQIIENLKINNKKDAIEYAFIFATIFVVCIVKITLSNYTEFIYFNF